MLTYQRMLCGAVAVALTMSTMTGCTQSTTSTTSATAATAATATPTAAVAASSVETSSVETGENTFAYTDDTTEAPVSTTLTGMVESVSGNEVTLSIGGGMGSAPSGSAPSGSAPSGDTAAAAENTAAATGTAAAGTATDTAAAENGTAAAGTATDTTAAGSTTAAAAPSDAASGGTTQSGTPGDPPSGTTGTTGAAGSTDSQTGVLTIGDESVISVADDSGTATTGTMDDITEGVMLEITFDDSGAITAISVTAAMGGAMGQAGGPGGQSSGVDSYDAVNEYTEDTSVDGDSLSSTGTDENAVLVSGDDASVTLNNVTVDRTSSDSTGGDNSSFYGVGAAILGTAGTTYINNSKITTDAAGAAGVFSYGDNTTYVANTDISTQQNTSGGIHVAGGGTLYAWQLAVETQGESAAAIRSDRGGGTMVVDGGTYTSNGVGSPAVYCTADIAVNDATLTANGSEAICMEGLNTIHLFDCDITGNMADLDQNDTTWNIIVYQSMSGDSEVGNSTMQIVGGSLTAKNGGMIYTTNTECDILMSDVDITYPEDNKFFLMCTGNTNDRGWGTAGANGSQCNFTADNQAMEGDVIWDSISELDFYMTNGSTLKGAFVDDESYAGNGGDGYSNLYISDDSTWTVTGDSTVTNLYNAGTIVDESGNTVSVVGTDGTVYVTGTSSYTITVSSYSTTADLSGATQTDSWSNHEVEMPSELQ